MIDALLRTHYGVAADNLDLMLAQVITSYLLLFQSANSDLNFYLSDLQTSDSQCAGCRFFSLVFCIFVRVDPRGKPCRRFSTKGSHSNDKMF